MALPVSVDWKRVAAVENNEPANPDVAALADAHRGNRANVALLATSASESLRDKTFPGSYSLFEDRVRQVGLDDLPVLPTPAVWSLTFWDRSCWVDIEKYRQLKGATWEMLLPNIEEAPWHRMGAGAFNEIAHTPEMKNWRNAWCDVHNLVTHIDHRRDVVGATNTKHYQRNAEKLRDLGVARIVTPAQARALVEPRG